MSIFSKSTSTFGLDISTTSVKVVQLKKGGSKKPSLLTYGAISIPEKLSKSDSKADLKQVGLAIKQLLKKSGISTNQVVMALPGSSVFTSSAIKLPKMSDKELNEAISWEARQYIPVPLEEVVLDWKVVKKTDEGSEVFIAAAPNKLVKKYMDLAEAADLKIDSLEIAPIAIARALFGDSAEAYGVVDIGASGTEISVFDAGVLKLVRSLQTGGEAFTRAIAKELGIEKERAEQFKRDFGLTQSKLEGQIVRTLSPLVNSINQEIKRATDFFVSQSGKEIAKIVLCGGSAQMPELPVFIADALKREVVVADPWADIDFPPDLAPTLQQLAPGFAGAVGLARK